MIQKVELTDNQQELIIDFVAKHIKDNGDVGVRKSNTEYTLDINSIKYKIEMSMFNNNRLFGITVINKELNTYAMAVVYDLYKSSQLIENINYITKFMLNKCVKNQKVDDHFFSKLTSIDSDKQISRFKKINKIRKKIF